MALEIGIGADISELKDKLAEAQLALEKLRKQKSADVKVGLDVTALQKQINEAKANISGLTKQINTNTSAFQNHSKATNAGGNTLMQFSRIAQDAPFGLMGIGNNLTATAEAFTGLSKTAGGAGNALKAVGASLMGPGGILLALSLVTSGLTYMSQKGITLSDVFDKLSGKSDGLKESIKAVNDELVKNGDEYAKQKLSAQILYKTATDLNQSYKDRKRAVDELQTQYPFYFKNLTDEQIMAGKAADKYTELQKAILDTARARAAEGLLEKKELERLQKEIDLKNKLTEAAKAYNKGAKIDNSQNQTTYGGGGGSVVGGGGTVSGVTREQAIKAAKSTYEQAKKDLKQLNKDFEKENQFLIDTIQKGNAIEGTIKPPKPPKKQKAKNDTYALERELQDKLKAMNVIAFSDKIALIDSYSKIELSKRNKLKDDILKQEETYNKSILDGQNKLAAASALAKSEEYNNQKEQRQKALDEATADIEATENFLSNVGKTETQKRSDQDRASYSARLVQLKKFLAQKLITQQEYDALAFEAAKNTNATLEQFSNDAYSLVTGSLTDTFGQLGNVIGNALATGGSVINAVGGVLLQSLGKFLSEMGGLLIQYGTMAVIKGKLDTAIAVGGPVAIGAGLAAIGVGIALKAIGGAIAAKAQGGATSGASGGSTSNIQTGANVSSPQSSVSNGGTFNNTSGTVVFEIAGQKLIGVLNNTLGANTRLGGNLAIGN